MSNPNPIGFFLVPIRDGIDIEAQVFTANWQQHFHSVPVTEPVWTVLDRCGFSEALQRLSKDLVDRFEEASFEDATKVSALCDQYASRIDDVAALVTLNDLKDLTTATPHRPVLLMLR